MKKLIGILLLSTLSFNLVSLDVSAKESEEINEENPIIEPIELNTNQIQELQDLGFDNDEIYSMSKEEYDNFGNLNGELTDKDENYYKVVTNLEGEIIESTEISEEVAENLLDIQNNQISLLAAKVKETKTTGLLKMSLSSSKLSGGKILLKNSYRWLKAPAIGLKDVVAISHGANAVKVKGTLVSKHKYSDGQGVHNVKASATKLNYYGVAKTFDVKVIGADVSPYDQHGYISVQVEKANKNDIKSNGYGHYTHVTLGITGTVDIKSGNISIGGAIKKTAMNDVMVTFKY
ncbi:hypothetical protein M2M59_09455 [Rummeliibacillus sp. G93]|uniref:hypothetical protein n=1 Tax=Rummeliibacillus sp. G93 TaxID=2939494 RepID=UPI00201C6556|nr:hypothetical protein [Rummeliibacillus sp. G93]UQW96239.1 hypothetical protein M2M59_09455 [Rummeliibacillus sp. G93]